jgi:hypothetical protein
MKVSEEHVLRMLRISGYESDDAARLIHGIKFPAELDDVIRVLSRVGITTDFLIDRMGGSP